MSQDESAGGGPPFTEERVAAVGRAALLAVEVSELASHSVAWKLLKTLPLSDDRDFWSHAQGIVGYLLRSVLTSERAYAHSLARRPQLHVSEPLRIVSGAHLIRHRRDAKFGYEQWRKKLDRLMSLLDGESAYATLHAGLADAIDEMMSPVTSVYRASDGA